MGDQPAAKANLEPEKNLTRKESGVVGSGETNIEPTPAQNDGTFGRKAMPENIAKRNAQDAYPAGDSNLNLLEDSILPTKRKVDGSSLAQPAAETKRDVQPSISQSKPVDGKITSAPVVAESTPIPVPNRNERNVDAALKGAPQ